MTAELLFNLLPEEISSHYLNRGRLSDLKVNLNNYFEYIDEGSDREVFAINRDFVLKIEEGNYQSKSEWFTYQEKKDIRISTKIYSNEWLASRGIIFAERVIPMRDYFYDMLKECELDVDITEYMYDINDFNADYDGYDDLYSMLSGKISEDVLEELGNFVELSVEHQLHDMHTQNIGVARDGTFLALDLGLGSNF